MSVSAPLPAARAADERYPWVLIGLLWMVAFLNAADRSILVAVMPHLRQEFGLSPTQLALINSVFFWVYAAGALLSGRLGDSVRRTRLILFGLVFWSLATGLVPLATGFVMLLGLRALVAAGEATYYPTATALISDWHRPAMRSRALSLHQTGVFAGSGLGALIAGAIADQLGWRVPFVVFAVAGFIVAGILLVGLRDAPPRAQAVVGPGSITPAAEEPFAVVWRIKPALLLCAVFFLATGASSSLLVWAPTFVHDRMGTNLAGSAIFGSMSINIAGFLSVPLGGLLADKLATHSPIGRFYTLAIGLALAALCLLPLPLADTAAVVGVVLLASSAGKGLFDGCIYSAMHDVVPPQARATAVGLMTTCGFVGAGIFPIVVARASETFGMAAGLTSLAVLYGLAVLLILLARTSIAGAVAAQGHER
jgi:MFS family permease